jgi:hypothetical protein
MSTAATRWWCHSAARHALTGHGPTASVVVWWLRQPAQKACAWLRQPAQNSVQVATSMHFEGQRRLIRHGAPGVPATLSAEQMEARKRAVDELLSRDDHEV